MNCIKNLQKQNKSKIDILLVIVFSVIYSIIFNAIDFIRYPLKSGSTFDTTLVFILSVILVFYFFLVASLNKILFNFIVLISTFLSSLALYYIVLYKIRIYLLDTFILLIQTNLHEAMGVISLDLLIVSGIAVIISIVFLHMYNKTIINSYYRFKIIIIILLTPMLFLFYQLRPVMPYAFIYATKMYASYLHEIHQHRFDIASIPTTFDATKNKDLIAVLIIGDAARADHFSINGYTHRTSPSIEQLKVISLPHIDSIHGVTNKCVPLMLTRATEKTYKITYQETSFISIFKKHGFTTAWISNQDIIDNSYSNISFFAHEANIQKQVGYELSSTKDVNITDDKVLDEKMLPTFDNMLSSKNPKLIILHCMGSHWKYDKHYPDTFTKFTPPCTNSNVARCKHNELINSYDNSILYADYFISQVIKRLVSKNAIVIYCSDHGEFLGEDGYYGHIPGLRRKEITNPAMFVWMSEIYKNRNYDKFKNLIANKDKKLPINIIFHSILDAASIKGQVIDTKYDIFATMK
jgi:glucan phosphoethanolaminetransferase (alkaline phosphatase superfamily)